MPTRPAHAKVNLFLRILAREESGYHGIETLFCRIALADDVSVEKDGTGIELHIDGAVPGEPRDNLVWCAAEVFFARIGVPPAVRIRLTKRIPIGTGLGGGSSDAAATLLALNELHGNPVTDEELIRIGGTLGSDVAFFMTGADLALAWGRGDRLLVLEALPERPLLIVVPPVPMATAAAYRMLARSRESGPPPGARAVSLDSLTSWERLAPHAANDFEGVVLNAIPGLASIREMLGRSGARIALLSGSGSALFGVFDDEDTRDRAAATIREAHPDPTVVETQTTGSDQR
jgi:4-diphosphocytidyl-2-C-methyl-D-erythritol kinase